jgi:LEA14-like dessication related protein
MRARSMKVVGRILLVLLAIILIVALIMFIRWQVKKTEDPDATFVLPRLHVASLEMERFDMEETRMIMDLRIDQPVPVPLQLDSLTYVVLLDTVEIARSTYAHDVRIPAMGSGTISTPFTTRTNRLTEILNHWEEAGVDSVDHVLVATFHSPVLFWRNEPAQVRIVERLPAYRIPKVSLHNPKIEKFGIGESRIMVDVMVVNPNSFAYNFKETDIEVKVRGDEILKARVDDPIHLPINDTAVVRVPLELSPGRALRSAWDYLFNAPSTPYEFKISTTIVSQEGALNNSHFEFFGEGTLKELKDQ